MDNHVNPTFIPSEIRDQVLHSLDTKPLGRLKCVDRHWNHMISSKLFVDSHLDRVKRELKYSFIHKNYVSDPPVCYLADGYGEPGTRRYISEDSENFEVLGSYNGLVLICTTADEYILRNPCTNQNLILPPVPQNLRPYLSQERAYFGLGYDVLHDDFLVMRVSSFFQLEGNLYSVMLYSRNMNSWWSLPQFPSQFHLTENSVYIGGLFHWKVRSGNEHAIVTFDFNARVYDQFAVPAFILQPWFCQMEGLDDNNLAVYADLLSVDEFGVSRYFIEVHTLTYLNAVRTWSTFTIFREEILPDDFALTPICYLNPARTQIMFSVKPYGTFFSYDILSRNFRRMNEIESWPGCAKSYKYMDTLVSPHRNLAI